jgi:nucleoporin SEH1
MQAHDAPILRLSFAHPLHGSLLASCSHDRTVRIWEEPPSSSGKSGRWVERAVLSGAKGSVRGVEFSPPNPSVGLRIVRNGVAWRDVDWQLPLRAGISARR